MPPHPHIPFAVVGAAVWEGVLGAIISSIAVAIGGMLTVWWRFSRDNKAIAKSLVDHEKQLEAKASRESVVKLAELLDKLQRDVTDHHYDQKRHRNDDSEKRFDDLRAAVEAFANENRDDHKSIMAMIRNGGK